MNKQDILFGMLKTLLLLQGVPKETIKGWDNLWEKEEMNEESN